MGNHKHLEGLTLYQYLDRLTDDDKKCLADFPLDAQVIISKDDRDLGKLKLVYGLNLTDLEQSHREELIEDIRYLGIFERIKESGKSSNGNGNGNGSGSSKTDDTSNKSKEKEKESKLRLYRIAEQIQQKQDIFVDQYHAPYAFVKINEHMEVLDLYSLRFQHWVYKKLIFYDDYGQAVLPEPSDVTRVLDYLKAHAEFDAVQKILHLRVAEDSDNNIIYYDLSNPSWEIVKITPQGWSIEKTPTVMFRRVKSQLPQVQPSSEYPQDIFDRFISLTNIKSEDHKLLFKCYTISLIIPNIAKAILMLHGEPNSAKTTLLKFPKAIIDPCSTETLTYKNDGGELAQIFYNNYLAYFDNLSYISDWLSDAFCKAVTGDSFSKRKLYTDNDDVFYSFMRCLGFSGVNLAATKTDLLRRGLIIELERISSDNQQLFKKIWKEFEEMKPQLLGYIFDIIVKVLNMKQTSQLMIKGLPTLADWAEACELISRCMGYEDNQFLQAFSRNVALQNEAAIDDSAVGQAIIAFMEDRQTWQGSAGQLLLSLSEIAPSLSINTKNHKIWPSKSNVLTRRLKYIISNLKEYGITVQHDQDKDPKTRVKIIRLEKHRSDRSDRSQAQIHAQNTSDIPNDISSPERYISFADKTSFAKTPENRAQNDGPNDANDANDIIPTLHKSEDNNNIHDLAPSNDHPGKKYCIKCKFLGSDSFWEEYGHSLNCVVKEAV